MLKKTFLLLFFIIFILFFININESKASKVYFYNDDFLTLPDLPVDDSKKYIIRYDDYWKAFGIWIVNNWDNDSFFYLDSDARINVNNSNFTLYYCFLNNLNVWELRSENASHIDLGTYLIDKQLEQLVFSSSLIYDSIDKTDIFFLGSSEFYIKTEINTNNSATFKSSFFAEDDILDWEVSISKDNLDNFKLMNYASISKDGLTFYYFTIDVFDNATYYFEFKSNKLNTSYYLSVELKDLISDIDLSLYLSTTENTTEPIYVLSNKYYYDAEYNASDDFLNNYDIDVSYGYDEKYLYAPLSITGYDEEVGKSFTQYQFKIVVNGIYKFKILNFSTQEITYQTFNISNIGIKNQWGEDVYYDNYDEDGNFDPTPVLFLEYIDTTTVRIRTQPFSFNEIINLKCSTKFEDGEYQENRNIYNYSIDSGNTFYDNKTGVKETIVDLYYFYIDVNVDGNYFFQFYNIENKNTTEGSIYVDINQFIIDNIDNIEKFTDKMVAWSKLHFGFLTYPFELIINIFGRVQNITIEEPILTIPTLKDPFTKTVILNQTSYNLKDAVNMSETSSLLYDIYLVFADVILIFLFLLLCKKTFGEVFK